MRLVAGVLLVAAALAVAAGQAISDRGEPLSVSHAFSIDGRRFVVEGPSRAGRSLVERELARQGIDVGAMPDDLGSAVGSAAVEPLREEPGDDAAPPLPGGFEAEHVLRLQSATGPFEIVFGRVARAHRDILRRLQSAGWECREVEARTTFGAIAQITGRKEASVVFLDKAEGRFLAIRRPAR